MRLEFDILRLGRRLDAVLVTTNAVIPIEFKLGTKKFEQVDYEQPTFDSALHLSTSVRSFHAKNLSRFVKALLDGDVGTGHEYFKSFRDRYPIVLTRSMRRARRWMRQQRRGTERAGLVASSSAQRLKRQAIDFRINIDPVHCFLNAEKDTRSSLSRTQSAHSFRGAKWTDVKKPERRRYLKNAYRVLLERVRRGMVIFVPPGAKRDKTRRPGFYDGVPQFLADRGPAGL